ncbi:MAG TPA: ribokinase [Acidimicrobiia bacterium]|nr:ribokinase [Acidimicrobiia bacterium]
MSSAVPALTVVGSVNLDFVVRLPRLPVAGETVTEGLLAIHPGGKGANQALAARRMGADVSLVAAVGNDAHAEAAVELLRAAGVNLDRCWSFEGAATGVALVMVGERGENQIGVAPGANRLLTSDVLELTPDEAVLCQLEVPLETVEAAARTSTGFFALNAAPARPLPSAVLTRADLLIVNEVERDFYHEQLEAVPGLVVVTMGGAGAVAFRRGRPVAQAAPPQVEVVDTVGAGDAFVGAFTVSLLEGMGLEPALTRACAAGALAASRPGAQPSLPTAADVDAIMGR